MTDSRFQQFVISDSDEDSADEEVISRREKRNAADGGSNTQHPVRTRTAAMPPSDRVSATAYPTEEVNASAHHADAAPRTPATPLADPTPEAAEATNQSSLSFRIEGNTSRNVTDGTSPRRNQVEGMSIKFDSEPPTPGRSMATPQIPASRTSDISFRTEPRNPLARSGAAAALASASSMPLTPRSVGGAPPVPVHRGPGSVSSAVAVPSAPPAADSSRASRASRGSTPRYALEDGSNRNSPQELNTPRESVRSANSDGEKKKRKKVVRKRVVTRRRKGDDPNAPGEIVSEEIIAPGRTGSPAPPVPPGQAPPPSRVSPRALRAASSRMNTPRSESAEVGPRPALPPSRGQTPATPRGGAGAGTGGVVERKVAPLIPGRVPTANATPHSARTPQSARSSIVIQEEEGDTRTADRGSTKRSVRSGNASAKGVSPRVHTPRSAAGSRSPGTLDFHLEEEEDPNTSISFQVGTTTSHDHVSMPRAHAPQVPTASALATPRSTYEMDDDGNVVRIAPARVRQQVKPDGTVVWVFVGEHRDDSNAAVTREIPAPPKKLSQRAQDIMAAKRRAVEQSAKKRHAAPKSARRPRQRYNFPATSYYNKNTALRHVAAALAAGNSEWTSHRYDQQAACQRILSADLSKDVRWQTEQMVRAIQPIQVGGPGSGSISARCSCVEYVADKEAPLGEMLRSEALIEEGFKRYLNLQPMQLANVELQDLTDPQPLGTPSASRHPSVSPSHTGTGAVDAKHNNPERGLATLGGLWCTAEALREDGRPATRKDTKAPRRVMRVCGGPALGLPLKEEGQSLDVRCYELVLFPQESVSPSAVNYGSEGLTLGQLISPPASSFPLTPRIVDDPIQLKEYKKKLLASKSRSVAMQNSEDDRLTFFGPGATSSITGTPATAKEGGTPREGIPPAAAGGAAGTAGQYLTITLVTLNSRQKHTIDLTLVLLPYRTTNVDGGKTLAEVPRFCPFTVAANRRLQGLSLSFSTKSSFMSAYRSLLWATECNIIDIQPTPANAGGHASAQKSLPVMNLRVSATPCPLLPWSASLGKGKPDVDPHETFHGNCVDFAVITLSASPTFTNSAEAGYRDPLTLDDFVIEEYNGGGNGEGSEGGEEDAKSRQVVRRRSSIFTTTLVPPSSRNKEGNLDATAAPEGTTVVGLTSFGVLRRAVNQRTSEVFDVRVVPRNRARMCPAFDEESHTIRTAKMEEEQLLQQDVEAAIMMEYASRLPFLSRVYGVLVDEQRYYVFQEPWISALALEQSAAGSAERDALEFNPVLKSISDRTSVMSLKEFIHGVLRSDGGDGGDGKATVVVAAEEAKLQIAQVLISQLLLLIASLHGKGMLLGPCPPHRLLVRVETPASARHDGAAEGTTNLEDGEEPTPLKGAKGDASAPPPITSKHVQLCALDLGVNTYAWSFERQQCGVLEYVAPSYVFEYMLGDDIGKESRAWTMRDDWWSFLCICFELLAADGSALVKPAEEPVTPTPTPIISKFSSPVDILHIWKAVLTNEEATGGTVSEMVAARVHEFVRCRVLESISPALDSWIANKADELELFGTTATAANGKRRKSTVRAVPSTGAAAAATSKMIGVSLASMYFKTNRDTPSNASDTSTGIHFTEDPPVDAAATENILREMPWIFHYRNLFDSIVDAVYPQDGDATCTVHGPSTHLLSHPFFSTLDLGQVFDGTQPLPRAAAHAIRTQMTKAKVKDALLMYRTRAYRGPIPKRPEYPLMITGSAFNMGVNNGAAPLLLLTSPAYRDELSARETDGDHSGLQYGDGGAWQGLPPQEGLVTSPANSFPPSVVPSPRARSPGMGQPQAQPQQVPWSQQGRLRAMYKNDELQSIAQLESEVRGALYSHTAARDSISRREMDIPPTTTNAAAADTPPEERQLPSAAAPPMSLRSDQGVGANYQFLQPAERPARTGSAASSRRRDPNAYQAVSADNSVLAPPADELHSDAGGSASASHHSGPAPYQQTSTNPYVNTHSVADLGERGSAAGGATPHRVNTPRGLGASQRSRPVPGSSRRSQSNGNSTTNRIDYDEIERSLNELATGPRRGSRTNSSGSVKAASTAGSGAAPRSHASESGRWPSEFLGTANLEKKGTPMKLSDPLISGAASGGSSTPLKGSRQGNVVVAQEPHRRPIEQRQTTRQAALRSSSKPNSNRNNAEEDASIVLVPSDDDESGVFVPRNNRTGAGVRGSTYQSSAASRNTPSRKRAVPAWRRASADGRDAYFEF